MKIYDVGAKVIPACVVFEYRGLKISASPILGHCSVFVCDMKTDEFLSPQLLSIEEAVAWADRHTLPSHRRETLQ